MSFCEALQNLSCLSTRHLNQNDEIDKLLKDYLKLHATALTEDEKTKLYKILNNLSDFQTFLYEIIRKTRSNTTENELGHHNFHSNIINIIFLLAKIGLLETSQLFNELSIINNEHVDKKDLELEVIREVNDDNINDHVPLEIILNDVCTKVEAKIKLDELSTELGNINIRKFQFNELKQATNYFNEDKYEGIAKPGRQVGPGRIGKVFLGVHLIENTPLVVVKRVRQVDKHLNHFMRELRTVSQLKHPNIIKLLGYSVDELPCLIYEYTPHGSLKRFLYNSKFVRNFYEAKDRVNTLMQVASALKYLHVEKEMVHGDIKPENILLDHSTAKLCGFGVINDGVIKGGVTNRIVGTNFYMAPELANDDYSWLSDVYAFGVVMLQVLTGMKVFDSHRSEFERYLVSFEHKFQ